MIYRFYSNSEEAKHHRVSIAGQYSKGVLYVAVAICSNNDTFRKKVGRAIAEGRLAHGRIYKKIHLPAITTEIFIQEALKVVAEVSKDKDPVKEQLEIPQAEPAK